MRVAEAAVAAARKPHAITRVHDFREQRLLILVEHLRARRHLDDDVRAGRTGAVLAHATDAALGFEVLLVAVVDQRVEVGDALDPDIAALAAVAAVGPAEFDELLAPERHGAGSARAGGDVDLGLVEELHASYALRRELAPSSVAGRSVGYTNAIVIQAGPPASLPSHARQRGRATSRATWAGMSCSARLASSQ